MKGITMNNSIYYIILIALFVGTMQAEETPTQQGFCDRIGNWINHYYSVSPDRAYRFSNGTVPDFKQLEDLPSKPWYQNLFFWRTKKQPIFDAMYGSNKKFSENLVEEMDAILVPIVNDLPEARIPATAELKDHFQWESNPFYSYQKFGDLWQKIVNKNVDHVKSRSCDVPQQPLFYSELEQTQRAAIKKEQKILKEAINVLDTTRKASRYAWSANYKMVNRIEDDMDENNCHSYDNEACRALSNTARKLSRENKLLSENHYRAYKMLFQLHNRNTFLRETKRDMDKELQ
jgi:hypothetical protein